MLDPDRLFPLEKSARRLARDLYKTVSDLPIISPHGHTDPRWFAENCKFPDPAQLFVTPDHYVFRMLYSQGVQLEDLGLSRLAGANKVVDGRKIWRLLLKIITFFVRRLPKCGLTTVLKMSLALLMLFSKNCRYVL